MGMINESKPKLHISFCMTALHLMRNPKPTDQLGHQSPCEKCSWFDTRAWSFMDNWRLHGHVREKLSKNIASHLFWSYAKTVSLKVSSWLTGSLTRHSTGHCMSKNEQQSEWRPKGQWQMHNDKLKRQTSWDRLTTPWPLRMPSRGSCLLRRTRITSGTEFLSSDGSMFWTLMHNYSKSLRIAIQNFLLAEGGLNYLTLGPDSWWWSSLRNNNAGDISHHR